MVKNTPHGPMGQDPSPRLVLSLLSVICQSVGHTFSWYNSKKGRAWLAFKANSGVGYTTSVEYSNALSERESLDTLALLMARHMRKVLEIEPPVVTWLGGKHSPEEYATAWQEIRELATEFIARLELEGMATLPTIQALLRDNGIALEGQETEA